MSGKTFRGEKMIVVHDKRLPYKYVEVLSAKMPGSVWYPLDMPAEGRAYSSIAFHPDIYFFRLDRKTLIHAPGVPEVLLDALTENGIDLVEGEGSPHGVYPQTVRYSAVRVGNIILHDLRHTDAVILRKVHEAGLKTVHVRQGYTRCSILVLNDEAIVTSDRGIAETAKKEGIEALCVASGHISLPGEKYGFIGGAGGSVPAGAVILLGDIDLHPDASRIKDFFYEKRTELICAEDMGLYDAGSLMIL